MGSGREGSCLRLESPVYCRTCAYLRLCFSDGESASAKSSPDEVELCLSHAANDVAATPAAVMLIRVFQLQVVAAPRRNGRHLRSVGEIEVQVLKCVFLGGECTFTRRRIFVFWAPPAWLGTTSQPVRWLTPLCSHWRFNRWQRIVERTTETVGPVLHYHSASFSAKEDGFTPVLVPRDHVFSCFCIFLSDKHRPTRSRLSPPLHEVGRRRSNR